tara:strand:- start:24 stop:1043 length:1020 start_codon:yes stop_codon:yes gene_type:complete
MSEFKVNTITNKDGSHGPQICGITTFGSSGMQLPSGPTEMRGGRGRGVFSGGRNNPVFHDTMNLVEIATTGNAVDFGNLSKTVNGGSGNISNSTRGITSGGYDNVAAANASHIDYHIFSSSGGVSDFGDLTEASNAHGGYSNGRRGIFAMGYPTYSGQLTFITIATTGDATAFGSLTSPPAVADAGGINSPTRAILHGLNNADGNIGMCEFVTFETLGNSQEFGNLSVTRQAGSGCSSLTRGISQGGLAPSVSDVIDYCTIATLGDFIDFGNLTQARRSPGGCSSLTRGLMGGGTTPTNQNTIDFITISTTGNSTDFGDLTYSARNVKGNSDSHGGLAQ